MDIFYEHFLYFVVMYHEVQRDLYCVTKTPVFLTTASQDGFCSFFLRYTYFLPFYYKGLPSDIPRVFLFLLLLFFRISYRFFFIGFFYFYYQAYSFYKYCSVGL